MSQDTDLAKEDVRDQKLTTEWEQRLKRIRDDVAALRRCKPILVGESSKLLNELEATARECTVEITNLLNEHHNRALAHAEQEHIIEGLSRVIDESRKVAARLGCLLSSLY